MWGPSRSAHIPMKLKYLSWPKLCHFYHGQISFLKLSNCWQKFQCIKVVRPLWIDFSRRPDSNYIKWPLRGGSTSVFVVTSKRCYWWLDGNVCRLSGFDSQPQVIDALKKFSFTLRRDQNCLIKSIWMSFRDKSFSVLVLCDCREEVPLCPGWLAAGKKIIQYKNAFQ